MNPVLDDLRQLLPAPWSSAALALVAALCGAIVGAEREKKEKAAGLRTMTLVSLGAAVLTMVSFAVAGPQFDRGRIAAQIVSGVGFLGAGAILRGPSGVQGLTTAATIWVAAAIGMVVGAGYAVAGIGLSTLIFLLLIAAPLIEMRYLGPCSFARAALVFDPTGGKALVKIDEILDGYRIPRAARHLESAPDGAALLKFAYCHAHKHHREFLTQLCALPEIREIRRDGFELAAPNEAGGPRKDPHAQAPPGL